MLMAADRRRIDRTDIWILTEIVPVSVAQEKVEPRQEDAEVRKKIKIQSIRNTGRSSICGK